MEGLFFAVNPIYWEGRIGLSEIIAVVMLCFLIYIVSLYIKHLAKMRKSRIQKPKPINFVYSSLDDADFSTKTLSELKRIIANYYMPKKSTAHTVHEIGEYLFDSELIDVAVKLEKSIYLAERLEKDEREEVNTAIREFLDKSKKVLG